MPRPPRRRYCVGKCHHRRQFNLPEPTIQVRMEHEDHYISISLFYVPEIPPTLCWTLLLGQEAASDVFRHRGKPPHELQKQLETQSRQYWSPWTIIVCHLLLLQLGWNNVSKMCVMDSYLADTATRVSLDLSKRSTQCFCLSRLKVLGKLLEISNK